jgi:small-conductance mechanosensitive channel
MIGILVVFGAIIAVFTAYTFNLQRTTLAIGRKLAPQNPLLPTGMQDAITPPWQTRNNILMFAGWAAYAVLCFTMLAWYIALGLLLGTFCMGVSVVSLYLVPRPMSKKFVNKIRQSMEARRTGYKKAGDQQRAAAMEEVLRWFDTAMNK